MIPDIKIHGDRCGILAGHVIGPCLPLPHSVAYGNVQDNFGDGTTYSTSRSTSSSRKIWNVFKRRDIWAARRRASGTRHNMLYQHDGFLAH